MHAEVLSSGQLLDRMIDSLDNKSPLSIVSVGSTQSFVMAQYKVLTEEQFMNHDEAIYTNNGYFSRGFTFPNVQLRDEMVDAVKNADIVGYNMHYRVLKAGLMTEKVFKAYRIKPKYLFESLIRRVIVVSQRKKFKRLLKHRKIVLIGRIADEARDAMRKRWEKKLQFEIVKTINMCSYDEITDVKKELDRTDYELALLSAGVNAVILAPYIARNHGKVAFDLGQGMRSIITKEVVETGFVTAVGLEKLMKM